MPASWDASEAFCLHPTLHAGPAFPRDWLLGLRRWEDCSLQHFRHQQRLSGALAECREQGGAFGEA